MRNDTFNKRTMTMTARKKYKKEATKIVASL